MLILFLLWCFVLLNLLVLQSQQLLSENILLHMQVKIRVSVKNYLGRPVGVTLKSDNQAGKREQCTEHTGRSFSLLVGTEIFQWLKAGQNETWLKLCEGRDSTH